MRISVAMATYNGERYIQEQICSILRQTVVVDEIIIVDDCSSDATVDIIKKLASEHPVIKLFQNEQNLGYTNNFRKALSCTTGDIIFFADQDDIWMPNKVEKFKKVFAENRCSVVCSQYTLIDGNGNRIENISDYRLSGMHAIGKKEYGRITTLNLIIRNLFPGCTCCFTKEVKNIFLTIGSNGMIHDHAVLLIGSICSGVCYLNEPTIQYRIHANNNIGISKKSRLFRFDLKKPQKPVMVDFLEALNMIRKVPYCFFYICICYLRIPYMIAVLGRLIGG